MMVPQGDCGVVLGHHSVFLGGIAGLGFLTHLLAAATDVNYNPCKCFNLYFSPMFGFNIWNVKVFGKLCMI